MRLKKVKGAIKKIEASQYYTKEPEKNKNHWKEIFKNKNPIDIEIGMGKGNFIIGMAKKYPNINFIGMEMYDSVLVKAVQSLEKEENIIPNLGLILANADIIDTIFDKEINTIYLNFSDPWPKAKHAKRRLTSQNFLNKYDNIFENKNKIIMKTDNIDLFEYSIEMLKDNGYNLIEITNDLHSLNDKDNILTEYEKKYSDIGIKINRLKAVK